MKITKIFYPLIFSIYLLSCKSKNTYYYKTHFNFIVINKQSKKFINYTPKLFYSIEWGDIIYDSMENKYIGVSDTLKKYISYNYIDSTQSEYLELIFYTNKKFDHHPTIFALDELKNNLKIEATKFIDSTATFLIKKDIFNKIDKRIYIIFSSYNSTDKRIIYTLPPNPNNCSKLIIQLILPLKYIEYDFSYTRENLIFNNLFEKNPQLIETYKDSIRSKTLSYKMKKTHIYGVPRKLRKLKSEIW